MNQDVETTQSVEDVVAMAIDQERRRCVGIVLGEYATWKLSGEERIARVLDALATKLEHPESL